MLCNWSSSLSSSKEIEEGDTLGQNPFDINIIIILEQKKLIINHLIIKLKKHSGLETFCGTMHEHAPSSECTSI